jgi:UDP-N-acetylbacillosamine N-acetyltransferase
MSWLVKKQAEIIKRMTSLKSEVVVIGGGGHARSVMNLLASAGIIPSGFYDEVVHPDETIIGIKGFSIDELPSSGNIILAVGDNLLRRKYYSDLNSRIHKNAVIHSSALLEREVKTGNANLVFPRTLLNSYCTIGDNNIINSGAILEHESRIGSHCHISVGAIICGRVTIGDNCFIGAGAVVKDGIKITDNVTIGAGSVVIHDIKERGVYVGNPVRKIR